jgi:hypothetical protein
VADLRAGNVIKPIKPTPGVTTWKVANFAVYRGVNHKTRSLAGAAD